MEKNKTEGPSNSFREDSSKSLTDNLFGNLFPTKIEPLTPIITRKQLTVVKERQLEDCSGRETTNGLERARLEGFPDPEGKK